MAKRRRIDSELARYALQGIEAAIEKLQRQAAELRRSAGKVTARGNDRGDFARRAAAPMPSGADLAGLTGPRKRTMSADARRRISEAQKKRWAKQKAAGSPAAGTPRGRKPAGTPRRKVR